MSCFVKSRVGAQEGASEQATNDLLSFVQQASENSKREVDLLIDELRGLQKKLDNDREHVHQQIAEYTSLSQSTLQLTSIVLDGALAVKKLPWPQAG
jgi:cell shape-determining protein MreC